MNSEKFAKSALVPAIAPREQGRQAGAAYHIQGIDPGAQGKPTEKSILYSTVLMNNKVDASSVPTNVGLPLVVVATNLSTW